MAWIESHQTLKDHPKTHDLVARLGISRAEAIGHLHLLWWWCISYATDGILTGFNDAQIARAGEWTGDAKAFVEALVSAGFLDRGDGVLTVHDWLDFCGNVVERRLDRLGGKRERVAAISRRMESERTPLESERAPTQPNPTQPTYTSVHPQPAAALKKGHDCRFVKPTLDEVKAYCLERGGCVDPSRWYDYYEANGWRVGRNPMKDWRAAVRHWESREAKPKARHQDSMSEREKRTREVLTRVPE